MVSGYCSRCGALLRPGAPCCGRCGADVPGATAGGGAAVATAPAYAGFWIRVGAALIDGIVLSIVGNVLSSALLAGQTARLTPGPNGQLSTEELNQLLGALLLVFALNAVIGLVYYIVTLSKWGQTLGAKAVGIRVIREDDALLSPLGALVRTLVTYISSLPLLLGYFWMLWDAKKQTWHDKAAGCIVVRTS